MLNALLDTTARQSCYLMAVRAEYVVLATAKIRVNLGREKGVLGNVSSARVIVERQEEQPGNANNDA